MRWSSWARPRSPSPLSKRIVAAGHEVVSVVTQPDRPKGRGQPAGTARRSKKRRSGTACPSISRNASAVPKPLQQLAALAPDAMVVVGYGQIIPQSIIDIPPHGIINVHASLLPKYRGAGPIQWAIANGETRTGVTTMRIDAGLDTGDMLLEGRNRNRARRNRGGIGRAPGGHGR